MAPALDFGYGSGQQENQQGGMVTASGIEQEEALQIDPRYEAAYQISLEPQAYMQKDSGDASRIELLEAEVEELESLLDKEKTKNQKLRDEIDQSLQEKERLAAASQKDLNEVKSELDVCKSSLDFATQELQEKEDAMSEVEEELLLSKQQISQLQEDRLEQQEAWSYQLKEAERKTQAATSQIAERASLQVNNSAAENLKEKLASHQREIEIKSEQLREHQARIQGLETELKNLKSELQEKLQQISQLSIHKAELESQTQGLERQLGEREAIYQEKQARQKLDWEHVLRTEAQKFRRTEEELQKRIDAAKSVDSISEVKFREMARKLQEMEAYAQKEIHSLKSEKTSLGEKVVIYEYQLKEKKNKIEQLTDKLDDSRNGSSIVQTLSVQMSELRGDVAKLHREKKSLEQGKKILEEAEKTRTQERLNLIQHVSKLEQEKKTLNQRISELEKVRLVEGVVICVDLSSSLQSTQVTLAKEAFRIITSGIRSRNPKTHIGVIVQARSVLIVRNIDVVDRSTDVAINSEYGGGAESYHAALPQIQVMLSSFHYKHPKSRRRVILIGDGQAAGGYPEYIVNNFRDEGIPIHSVVIGGGHSLFSSSSQTSHMSSKTGGQEFAYVTSYDISSSDALLGRRR